MKLRIYNFAMMAWLAILPGFTMAAPGDLDTTFGLGGGVQIGVGVYGKAIAVQPNGKVVVVGEESSQFAVWRFNSNGSPDTTFSGDGKVVTSMGSYAQADAAVLQANGKIVVCGGVGDRVGVARYNSNGALDTTFNGTGKATVDLDLWAPMCSGLGVQKDGKVVVAAVGLSPSEVWLVRFNVDGTVDKTFGGSGSIATGLSAPGFNSNEHVTSLVIQGDGKILVTGCQTVTTTDIAVARYNSNGTPDVTFNGTGKVLTNFVNSDVGLDIALQFDGKIVVAGIAGATLGISPAGGEFAVVRYLPNGLPDPTFNGTGKATVSFAPGRCNPAFDLTIQPNGKMILVGTQDYAISNAKLAYARLTPNGVLDSGFGLNGKLTSTTTSFGRAALQPDGKILVLTGFSLLRLEGDPPAPEIAIEQPTGTHMVDESSVVDFGVVAAGSVASKTFSVKNIGNAGMTGVGVTIDGDDAADFSITTTPSSTLAALTGSTTFTVRFAPTMAGAKSAVLHIASDDPDEARFDIELSGNALSLLALGGTNFAVNEEAGVVNIPVVRSAGSSGPVSVNISTVNGSAVSSLSASSDFAAISNKIVTLEDGVDSLDVPITIHNPAGTTEANETFSVTLSNPSGAALSTPKTATVLIWDSSDTTDPIKPLIKAPLAGAKVTVDVNGRVNVTGTASDNQGVGSVEVSVNGGDFVPANITLTGTGAAIGKTANYTAAVTTVAGANTVTVKTFDLRGNESASVATVTFVALRPLVVDVVSATFGGVTAGFSPSSFREVGKTYSIKATAKTGGIFAGWSASGATPAELGIAPLALDSPSVTFIFREGLKLTANFIANPYGPAVYGTYNGLVSASVNEPDRGVPGDSGDDGTSTTSSTEGYFTTTVQGSGAFSGKLTIDGAVLPVSGLFDHQGRARFGPTRELTQTYTRTGKPSLIVKFDIGGPVGAVAPNGSIIGTVSATESGNSTIAAVSDVVAPRAYFTGLTALLTVPDPYLTVTGIAASPAGRSDGMFTVALPSVPLASQPPRISNVFTNGKYPQGDGVGKITVTKAGLVTLSATLADGTGVTASSKLSQDLRVGLFVLLYSSKGFLSAPVQLDSAQPESDLATATGGEVLWSRPPISTSQYYPDGWKDVLELELAGARYRATAGQSVMRAPDGADGDDAGEPLQALDVDGNVSLTMSNGKLVGMVVKSANLSITDAVTRIPANDPTFTMIVNRTTGMITGVFDHTDLTRPAYSAVIYQKGLGAGARGFFLTKQPVPIDYTGASGRVEVIGQP